MNNYRLNSAFINSQMYLIFVLLYYYRSGEAIVRLRGNFAINRAYKPMQRK